VHGAVVEVLEAVVVGFAVVVVVLAAAPVLVASVQFSRRA